MQSAESLIYLRLTLNVSRDVTSSDDAIILLSEFLTRDLVNIILLHHHSLLILKLGIDTSIRMFFKILERFRMFRKFHDIYKCRVCLFLLKFYDAVL